MTMPASSSQSAAPTTAVRRFTRCNASPSDPPDSTHTGCYGRSPPVTRSPREPTLYRQGADRAELRVHRQPGPCAQRRVRLGARHRRPLGADRVSPHRAPPDQPVECRGVAIRQVLKAQVWEPEQDHFGRPGRDGKRRRARPGPVATNAANTADTTTRCRQSYPPRVTVIAGTRP